MDREERAIERLEKRLEKEKGTEEMDYEKTEKLADAISGVMDGHPLWMCAMALTDVFCGLLTEAAGVDEHEDVPEAGLAWHLMMATFDHMHEAYHDHRDKK